MIFASGTIDLEAQVAEGSDGEDEAGIEPQSGTTVMALVGCAGQGISGPHSTATPDTFCLMWLLSSDGKASLTLIRSEKMANAISRNADTVSAFTSLNPLS